MNPNDSPQLFKDVAEPRITTLNEEFLRRNMVFATLNDLSSEFEAKAEATHPVTEATLVSKLFALSQVQLMRMGVVGFNPLDAVQSVAKAIEASTAPYHDEYTDGSSAYRTRVIKLKMPDADSDDVEIFGLNFYQPDSDIEEDINQSGSGQAEKSLVVVGHRGVMSDQKPITGETVIMGVRNKKTNDAKFYKVAVDNEYTYGLSTLLGRLNQESEFITRVLLPDGTVYIVEQLVGEEQREAVKEFQKSVEAFKTQPLPTDYMSAEEIDALESIQARRFRDIDTA